MQFIQVHEIRQGQDTIAGTIAFDGAHLIPNPPHDPVLLRMIADVQGSSSPLVAIHQKFRSAYLHTSPPQEADVQMT